MKVVNGVLTEPDLHDGRLLGIDLPGSDLSLRCMTEAGEKWNITLRNLVRLRADNFRQGNIIFEVLAFSGLNCPEELVRSVSEPGPNDEGLSEILAEIRRDAWTLLQVESSYGCSLLALARGTLEVSADTER